MDRAENIQEKQFLKNPDKETDNNNNYNSYNNYLSCQIPPNTNSPPTSEFINRYLTSILVNKKLDLNINTYENYQ